jgi:hypothetical protein
MVFAIPARPNAEAMKKPDYSACFDLITTNLPFPNNYGFIIPA